MARIPLTEEYEEVKAMLISQALRINLGSDSQPTGDSFRSK